MMKTSDQYKTVNYLATSELAFVNVQSQLKVERLSWEQRQLFAMEISGFFVTASKNKIIKTVQFLATHKSFIIFIMCMHIVMLKAHISRAALPGLISSISMKEKHLVLTLFLFGL